MKVKYFLALIQILATCPVLLYSQSVYFNNRYDVTPFNSEDWGKSLIIQDNDYIIQGETFNEYGRRSIFTMKIDSVGTLRWIKPFGNATGIYAPGKPGSLIKFGNNYYCAANSRTYTSNWVHDRGLLIKFDSEFDTLWSKEYGESTAPYDTAYIFWNINKTTDNCLIITGLRKPYALYTKPILIKTDSCGNIIWEQTYTNLPGYVEGWSVVQTTDGGYAIGAFSFYSIPPPNETGDPVVIKTDCEGNFQWIHNCGGDLTDTPAMVANSADGNILVLSAYSDSVSGGSDYAGKIHIVKLTNDNQVLFDRMYNRRLYMMDPRSIYCNPDGSIITTGTTGTKLEDYPFTVGWLFKTTSEGDSLWYREFQKIGSPNMYAPNNLLHGIPTSDQGYIACGYVLPQPPDTGTQDVWVVKVDSMGCESPTYCWVGVEEQQVAPKMGELLAFPNPAKDFFRVQFQQVSQKSLLQFVDMTGRKAEETNITPFTTTEVLNCSHWPPGVYFGQLICDGKIVAKGKVVVK